MSILPLPVLLALVAGSPRAPVANAEDVLLALATSRDDYVQHETVDLAVTVRNASDHDVRMMLVLAPDLGRLRVHWRPPGGEFEALDYPKPLGCRSAGGETWTPGRGIVLRLAVGFDESRGRFLLAAPGEHSFKLVYRPLSPKEGPALESDVVSVDVRAVSDGDHASFEAYDSEIARVAQHRMFSDRNPARAKRAAEYLERFPASPYAPAVRAGLRRYLGARRLDFTPDEEALSKRFGMGGGAEDYITLIPGEEK